MKSYKNFLILQPRINRIRHVALILSTLVALVCLEVFLGIIPFSINNNVFISSLNITLGVLYLITFLFIKTRRLHDINYSAWWVLAIFVPIFGWLFGLALFFIPGTKGTNKFGPEPEKSSKFEHYTALFLLILVAAMILIPLFMLFSQLKSVV